MKIASIDHFVLTVRSVADTCAFYERVLGKPGTGDFCLISGVPLETVVRHLEREGVAIEIGPVPKSGAAGPITSVYIRDPDDNLVEISEYQV